MKQKFITISVMFLFFFIGITIWLNQPESKAQPKTEQTSIEFDIEKIKTDAESELIKEEKEVIKKIKNFDSLKLEFEKLNNKYKIKKKISINKIDTIYKKQTDTIYDTVVLERKIYINKNKIDKNDTIEN